MYYLVWQRLSTVHRMYFQCFSTTWSWNISQSSQVLVSWPGTELPMSFLILETTGGGGRAPVAPTQLDGAGRTCITNTLGQSTNQSVILRGIKGRLWGQVGEVEKCWEKQEWAGELLAAAGKEDGLPQPAQPDSLQSLLIDGKYAKGWISSVQSLSRVWLFASLWTTAPQASLSITNSRSSLKLMSIETVMPSSHLILCRPLLLLPPIPPSIRVFSKESTLRMRWPNYWSFSFSISPQGVAYMKRQRESQLY